MEKINHSITPTFYFCKWCGKSMEYLINKNQESCLGAVGVIHIDYLIAKKKCNEIFEPILKNARLL